MENIYFVAAVWFFAAVFDPAVFSQSRPLVSIPAMFSAPGIFIVLFSGKVIAKIFGIYPATHHFCDYKKEKWYYTLLMSTGLTFGTISALYGLNNNIITQEQYSFIREKRPRTR